RVERAQVPGIGSCVLRGVSHSFFLIDDPLAVGRPVGRDLHSAFPEHFHVGPIRTLPRQIPSSVECGVHEALAVGRPDWTKGSAPYLFEGFLQVAIEIEQPDARKSGSDLEPLNRKFPAIRRKSRIAVLPIRVNDTQYLTLTIDPPKRLLIHAAAAIQECSAGRH